jgi:predicted RNase H-like HicB family nuclease
MEYTVIIYESEEGGYWAKVPALPGCYSQGETIDETLVNVKDAIESHIIALKEDGQDIPAEGRHIIASTKVAVSA